MFVFVVHRRSVGYSIILDLLAQGVEVKGTVSKEFGCKSMVHNWDGFDV